MDRGGPEEKRPTSSKPLVSPLTFISRDRGIRTRDPLNPIQVRYRAALRPVAAPKPGAKQTGEYSRS